ncbi:MULTISPECIES: hypothetical protein [unclassified Dyella]|uniref:hypothetical protein n=1 Tax=unclassified Dyella TaxID=2634549 RepID=UPI000C8591EE|nr:MULTISPECIES: hypothetical protein [unclassified Dyella]MDR3443808.1 hypothetical protein [Dyella sp.]
MIQIIRDVQRWWVLIVVWLCFSPIILSIPAGLETVRDARALADFQRTSSVTATIVDTRLYRGYEVRYAFDLGDRSYTKADEFGREDLWSDVSIRAWHSIQAGENKIAVTYLRSNPAISRPSPGVAKNSTSSDVADSYALLILLAVLTFGWLFAGERLRRFIVANRPAATVPYI